MKSPSGLRLFHILFVKGLGVFNIKLRIVFTRNKEPIFVLVDAKSAEHVLNTCPEISQQICWLTN